MTIIEMARQAQPGEFWTRRNGPAPRGCILEFSKIHVRGATWAHRANSFEPFSFELDDLLSDNWHRVTPQGKAALREGA